jgi:hypothetical protein
MATKTSDPRDTSTNQFLTSALARIPALVQSLEVDWRVAMEQKWEAYAQGIQKEIARAKIGAEKGPTDALRKRMKLHVKSLQSLLCHPPEEPDAWKTKTETLIGEAIMQTKDKQTSYGKTMTLLGQVDLTVEASYPSLRSLYLSKQVSIPNDSLPPDLRAARSVMWRAKEDEAEQWETPLSVTHVTDLEHKMHVTWRFVLAPTPCNYKKVLKEMQLMDSWLQMRGDLFDGTRFFGVITDDPVLLSIVVSQGNPAVLIKPQEGTAGLPAP